MRQWKEVKLGEICDVRDGTHDSPKQCMIGHSLITSKNLKSGSIDFKNTYLISDSDFHQINKRSKVDKNDILYSMIGTVGEIAIVKSDLPFAIKNVGLFKCGGSIDLAKWIYYYMKSSIAQEELSAAQKGSTQPYISLGDLRDFPILLPPLIEQQAISNVLSSLDDKIDLMHRQNEILEAMADTLFRQWFIEEANEGWEEKPLSSIAQFLNGLACQKFIPENDVDKLPVLKIRELSNGISSDSDWATNKVDKEFIVQNGDVIFAWSASLMVKIWDGETCVLNQHLFKVTSTIYPKWFYLMWCKHHLDEFISIAQTHATTMGHIKRGDLDSAVVLIPPEEVLNDMSQIMAPIINKQIDNSKQIKVLNNLRNTLLPKLISGEVRIDI